MTTKPTPLSHPIMALEGVEVVFLRPLEGLGEMLMRGQSVTLTAAMLDGTIDRLGRSWLEDLDDESSQVRKYGEHCYTRAQSLDAPVSPYVHGSPDWEQARADAHRQALFFPEGSDQRREALAAMQAEFGDPVSSTTILAEYRPDRRDPFAHV